MAVELPSLVEEEPKMAFGWSQLSVVEVQSVEPLAVDFAEVDKADVRIALGDTLHWMALESGDHVLSPVVALSPAAVDEATASRWVVVERDHVDLERRKAEADLVEASHLVGNKVYCFAS